MELANERPVLRPVVERDLEFFFVLRNRPEILTLPDHEPRPRSDVEHQLRGWIQRWQEHRFGAWTVFDRKTDERLGRVELDPMGPGWAGLPPNAIEVGCVVHPTHWNRGIATEAMRLAVADCFSRVGLDRLFALTTLDNKPSLRTMEKVGMRRRGETRHEHDPTTYELFELTPGQQRGATASE